MLPRDLLNDCSTDDVRDIGEAFVRLEKAAGDVVTSYGLSGRLYKSQSGWILLSVPNALVHGAFDALDEPGAELPPGKDGRPFNAHCSVIRPEELEKIPGGADAISERGHTFRYTLGKLKVVEPHGWDEMSKVWFIEIHSPELQQLRKSYGLSGLPKDGEFQFHITVAVRRKNVLRANDVAKAAAGDDEPIECEFCKEAGLGIPDRGNYGDLTQLQPGQMMDWFIQQHDARRAGPHKDVRFGNPQLGLFSWATRKELPAPGERTALFQQPVHSHAYGNFQGTLKGYGAGTVRQADKGRLLVTKVTPQAIHFTLAHRKFPERFVLVRPRGPEQKSWLLVNSTPREPVPYEKVRFTKIPADQVEQALGQIQAGSSVQAKVDGASSLIKLLDDGVELVSYRASKETGGPIVHTERFFGGRPNVQIPKELVGTILRGEIYGRKPDPTPGAAPGSSLVLHPSELGGILNATIANSLASQQERGVQLRSHLFDVQQVGNQPIDFAAVPYAKRREWLSKILPHLPQDRFEIAPEVTTAEEAKKLWQQISSGQHPLSQEGIVIHPPTGKPSKIKLTDDADVYVRGVFPGEGKYRDRAAGGFEYSIEPEGPIVGRVGTGLDDALRTELWNNQQDYIGRVAKIRYQEQLPSGAYRAPAFLNFHEDLPAAKTAADSHFVNALVAEPLQYDTSMPVAHNLLSHVGRVRDRGRRTIQEAEAAARIRAQLDPSYGAKRMQSALRGQNAVLHNPFDQLLNNVG